MHAARCMQTVDEGMITVLDKRSHRRTAATVSKLGNDEVDCVAPYRFHSRRRVR